MTKEEILTEINALKQEITQKTNRLEYLNRQFNALETDVREKFIQWCNNGIEKETLRFLPSGNVRKFVDEYFDLGSMRGSICLLDYPEFETFGYKFPNENADEINQLRNNTLFIAACEHMMNENFDSFEIDW